MKKKVTIRDVAREAGTSYQTVSRVINGKENVAQKTREKVLEAIDTLNYRPSVAARALNQNRTNVIAISSPFDSDYLFEDPNLLQVMYGIDKEAAVHDYSLLLSITRPNGDPISAYRRLLSRQLADGMIVSGETVDEEGIRMVIDKGYPVVIIGYNDLGVPCVHADDEEGAYHATRHLLQLGHEKVAIVTGPPHLLAVQARQRGLARALQEENLSIEPQLVVAGDFTTQSGYQATQQIVGEDFTALFAFTDRMALGAIQCLTEHNLRVPDDISVVGFDDIRAAEVSRPSLTTVRLSFAEQGRFAAHTLFRMLNNQPYDESVVIPSELVIRDSTRQI